MRLLDDLRRILEREHPLAHDRTGGSADIELQAATALLLLEAAHGDEEYVWREHQAIVGGLARSFGLGRAEVRKVLERSEEIRPPKVKLSEVTGVIRERYDEAQRTEVLRLLWRVIDSDGSVMEWEEVFADHVAHAVGLSNELAAAVRQEAKS